MMIKTIGAVVVVTVIAVAVCSPARTDPDRDYLNLVHSRPGVLASPINEAIYVNQGHHACDILHGGGTHDDAVEPLTTPIYVQPWLARTMVDAAQTLCPGTPQ